MGNNISLMGFTFFVKSNIGKYIPYRVDETAIKVVGREETGEEKPCLGIMIPGDKEHEPVMIDVMEGFHKLQEGIPAEDVMKELASI